jgi:thiocyanate hydrolase subunit beta
MSSPSDVEALQRRVQNLRPVPAGRLDSPYAISNDFCAALRHVPHDVGGQPDGPIAYLEKEELDWELDAYVTCECLGWCGLWTAEERRRRENDLGTAQYFGIPYYGRWVTVAARVLVDRDVVSVDELGAKIHKIRARKTAEREAGGKVTSR